MADNPQHDAPLPDPDGGEAVSEDDLDALLVEASQLASEISGEVGGAPTDATPLPAENPPDSDSSDLLSSPSGEDIDSQLATVDRLIDETQSEIGAPTPTAAVDFPSDAPPGDADHSDLPTADDSTAPSSAGLPDFMQEFTQPAADPPEKQTPSGRSKPAPQTPADSAPAPATTEVDRAKSAESAQSTEQAVATDRGNPQEGKPSLVSRLGHALSPLAFRATNRAVCVLEVVNSPTQRIGTGIRTAVGWVAIATIGTSVLVFLTSLF